MDGYFGIGQTFALGTVQIRLGLIPRDPVPHSRVRATISHPLRSLRLFFVVLMLRKYKSNENRALKSFESLHDWEP
jgi:hypothetical protein